MASLYLNRLTAEDRTTLLQDLHERQAGNCFICGIPHDIIADNMTLEGNCEEVTCII